MARGGRTCIKGKPASKKFQRATFSYDFKYQVAKDHGEGLTHEQLRAKFHARFYDRTVGSVRRLVSKWKRKIDVVERMATNVQTASQLRHREEGTGTVLSPEAERQIVEWINGLRHDGIPVSSSMLVLKAIEIAEDDGVPPGQFTASHTWKASFLHRHRLSFRARNRQGQASPDTDNVIGLAFAQQVRQWMAEYGVSKLLNADQTGVNFEMLPKKTIDERGSRTVWIKCGKKEKQWATTMLLADSDGNKYAPFIVFKTKDSTIEEVKTDNIAKRHGFGRKLWTEIMQLQKACGAQIYGNSTAWWNADLTLAWLKYFFDDRTDRSEPLLLLLDAFSGHWTDEVKQYAASRNIILKPVPPKLTWRSQPADVAWIKPLKDGLRRKWVDHLREQLDRRRDQTTKFVMQPPDRGDVAKWITEGWLHLSDRIIISGFSKCGFRDALRREDEDSSAERPLDATSVVGAIAQYGYVDHRVGEVDDTMDLLDTAEAVV